MKTVRLQQQEGCRFLLYPDNQPHVIVDTTFIQKGDEVRVVAPIRSSLEMIQLLELSNALGHIGADKTVLVVPYLLGARSDRLMQSGDSFDLEVIANLINLCEFKSVNLFDVHSKISTDLIKNSRNHNNSKLLKAYDKKNVILICPDKGALERLEYYKQHIDVKDVVFCEKNRDLTNGRITLKVNNPEKCEGQNCVISDDICDGGATFLAIADQIQPKDLTLIVSHGLFSKGFRKLEEKFNQIIVSDSYYGYFESKIVKIVPLNL